MRNEFIKELNDISPFMSDLRAKLLESESKTPPLYFEQLADNIIEKAKESPSEYKIVRDNHTVRVKEINKKVNTFTTIFRPLRAVAATFLLIGGSWLAFHTVSTKTVKQTTTTPIQIQRGDLQAFISENIEDYDENILVENAIINENDLNLETIDLKESKTDSELKKYLHDNFDTPVDEDL